MVALMRTEWSGTSGGPGVTQIALLGAGSDEWNPGGAQAAVNAMRAFWQSVRTYLPDELSLKVSPVIDTYDTETGELILSTTAATAPVVVTGGNTSTYAAGCGAKLNWNTGQIRNGRRVVGHTFIVPLASGGYTNTGTIDSVVTTAVNTAAATLLGALTTGGMSMGVWSRPRVVPTPRAGYATQVSSGLLGSKTAILRGRRD